MSCYNCSGSGEVKKTRRTLGGDREFKATCLDCGGSGNAYEKTLYKHFTIQKVDEKIYIVNELHSEFHSLEGSKAAIDATIQEFEEESEHLEPDEQYPNIFEYLKDIQEF